MSFHRPVGRTRFRLRALVTLFAFAAGCDVGSGGNSPLPRARPAVDGAGPVEIAIAGIVASVGIPLINFGLDRIGKGIDALTDDGGDLGTGAQLGDLNVGEWVSGDLIDFGSCPVCGPGDWPVDYGAATGAGGPGGLGSSFASGFGGGF